MIFIFIWLKFCNKGSEEIKKFENENKRKIEKHECKFDIN